MLERALGRRRSAWVGRAYFIAPVAVILIALIVLSFYSSEATAPGTLVVEAQVTVGSATRFASVQAEVTGVAKITPFNVTVSPGTYTVTYSPVKWYSAPPPKSVTVAGGKTAYSVGVYIPTPVDVTISQLGPNATSISAEHGVTPVTWFNTTGQTIKLTSSAFTASILPRGNYTAILSSPGDLTVTILPSGETMSLNVE